MPESGTKSSVVAWSVPECPFAIEISARALDDIRLAVTDAFFSLARGGVEIGGILLGTFTPHLLSIVEYAPLECEHAFGPGFAISLNDEARLRTLLTSVPGDFPGLQIVGWYHSHTRSEIFLSEQDLEVYRQFFPAPWQVAMVMKPHTFEPARIGFFFRDATGHIHAEASYKELTVEAQPFRAVPAGGPVPPPAPSAPEPVRQRPLPRMSQTKLDLAAPVEPVGAEPAAPEPVVAPEPVAAPAPIVAPAPAPVIATAVAAAPAVKPVEPPRKPAPAPAPPAPVESPDPDAAPH